MHRLSVRWHLLVQFLFQAQIIRPTFWLNDSHANQLTKSETKNTKSESKNFFNFKLS